MLLSLSKVMEKILKLQITDHLKKHDVFYRFQSGFRSNCSTASALLQVTNDIRINMSKNIATIVLLFDFFKVFDSVFHELVIDKVVD